MHRTTFMNTSMLIALVLIAMGSGMLKTTALAMGETPEPAPSEQTLTTADESADPEAAGKKKAYDAMAAAIARQEKYDKWTMGQCLVLSAKLLVLGMSVVMFVLWLIATTTSLLNNYEIKKHAATQAKASKPADPVAQDSAPSAPVAAEPDADALTSVVITAAVGAVLAGRQFQVRSIELTAPPSRQWSQMGRNAIHTSHQVRKQ